VVEPLVEGACINLVSFTLPLKPSILLLVDQQISLFGSVNSLWILVL